jgi:hypothetical protein
MPRLVCSSDGSDESWDPEEFIGMIVRDEEHGDLGEVTGIEGRRRTRCW